MVLQDGTTSSIKCFAGVGFVLLGFDPLEKVKVRSKLVSGGGVDVGEYGQRCSHLIVDKNVYDDSECVVARADGKVVVTALWVEHCIDVGMLVDSSSILYRPVKDLNGIPGAKSLSICLTGYQRQDRDDIMRMVALMGANFSKPLVANKVTHLICYKFEGEKYELAKKLKKIRLVNHSWLEDCLRTWEILPECDYNKSGYELEIMEAEAKDSEEEAEEDRNNKQRENCAPITMHSGSGSYITKGYEMPMLINQNEAAEKILSGRAEDIINEMRSVSSPKKEARSDKVPELHEVIRQGGDFTSQGSGSGVRISKGSEMSMLINSNEAAEKISSGRNEDIAIEKRLLTSPRKKARSDDITELHEANRRGADFTCQESGAYDRANLCKESSELFSKPITLQRSSPSDAANQGTVSYSRKIQGRASISKFSGLLSNQGSGSPHGDLEQYKVMEGIDISPPKLNQLKINQDSSKKSSDSELHLEGGKCNILPQKRKASLSNFSYKSPMKVTADSKACTTGSPLGSARTEGLLIDTPHLKSNAFYSNGEKCSGINKQKGSLRLGRETIAAEAIFSTMGGKEAEHRSTVGARCEVARSPSLTESVTRQETTANLSNENEVENTATGEGDETEAPEEEIGAELENTTREEIFNPRENVANKKKVELVQISTVEMNRDTAHIENVKGTLEKDEEDVNGANCKSDVQGGSVVKEKVVKGGGSVFSRRKNKSVSVVKKTEKSGKDKEVDLDKNNDEKTEMKKSNGKQRSASKLKSKPVSLDATEKPKNRDKDDQPIEKGDLVQARKRLSSDSEKILHPVVKESATAGVDKNAELEMVSNDGKMESEKAKGVQRPASKPKGKTSYLKNTSKQMDAEKENKPMETGSLSTSSGEHKRETVAAKLSRASMQIRKTVCGINVDGIQLGGGSQIFRPEPAWFIVSGHRLQRKEFQQVIRRLKGRVCRDSHNWSYQATHFIVPDPIRRTEKFFAAAASGRWILKTDYLTASNQAGKLLPEELYEWFKNGFSEDGAINLEAPRKWRLLRERTGHGAFHGMRIVIYGDCIAPPLDTLKRVVKAGDGVILATSPPYTRFLKSGVDFAVVSPSMPCVDSWVQEFLRHEIPCVVADYLVEYVCKPGSSLDRHVLFNTHACTEKSYAKLLSQSEEIFEALTPPECNKSNNREEDENSADISCQNCGSHDRGDVMLICGDDTGSFGCGVGTHIDCCNPPLGAVPEEDWFCQNCCKSRSNSNPPKKIKKGSSSKRK
ncbi:hypothetical protein IFM89_010605 [Coptis chinensis]|uniref:BRCT domain-containing protein n=1 Tax=Coptis chinensis TaxID=261450 RepID=A0A835MAN3_9MAGN|nr:hypothetical protein IFM89_010605 [Coptis chinensis]